MEPWFIALFVAASIGGTGLIAYALRAGQKNREALRAFAAENGWRFDYIPSSGGSASETIIADPQEGWTVTLYVFSSNSGSGGSVRRHTTFENPRHPTDGLAVLGPDIPEKTKQMADKMMGLMGGDVGRYLLDKITGGLGDEAQSLRTIDGPGAGTLLASPGAETALNGLRNAPELAAARAGRNEAQQPIIMRGPFGLRIRVTTYLKKPDDIAAFIALGRTLSAALDA